MKILVREMQNNVCNYVWKTVCKINPIDNSGRYCVEENGRKAYYYPINIIAISADYRKNGKYVICGNCGEVVRKSSLVSHYEKSESNSQCSRCDWLRLIPIEETRKNTFKSDGTVVTKLTQIAKCSCGTYHSYRAIADMDKLEHCKYYACRRSEAMELPSDVFSQYPNPYENLLTEKRIIEKGWKFLSVNNNGRSYENSNGKVIANFDTNGILICFTLFRRNKSFKFMYSDKYDVFFGTTSEYSNRYGLFFWGDLAEATVERYKKQIRKLYK